MKYAGTIIGIILIAVIISLPERHEHIKYECINNVVTVCLTTNSVVLESGRHIETGRTEHIKEDLQCEKIP